jgi:hypothetical protein
MDQPPGKIFFIKIKFERAYVRFILRILHVFGCGNYCINVFKMLFFGVETCMKINNFHLEGFVLFRVVT